MAEQIPYGVVVSVINRLGSLAFREIAMIYGVKSDIERLKDTAEAIKAVLVDAEQKQQKDQLIKLWIRRLKQVLFEADDLLDELHTKDLLSKRDGKGKGKVRHFFSSSNPVAFRLKVAHTIKKIREQFEAVAEEMSKLNLDRRVVVMSHEESNWRETSSFVLQEDIIGREESRREVIDLLLNTDSTQIAAPIAIVGIGGLGKTALAQLVYNDDEVKKFFNKRIWVCVSDDFNVKTLVKNILESSIGQKVDDQQLELLQDKLQKDLNGKKYLLVLDDVWNHDHEKWSHLKRYLMCGVPGSKILVTTRDQMVAKYMDVNTPYILKGLTNDIESFVKKIGIWIDGITSQNFELISQKIVDKCGGVPLAIRALGSLLQLKTEETEWEDILEGGFWKLSESNDLVMPKLQLSYDHLSFELRQCFAYCSLYPKDWTYNKDELIEQWMAQGYLGCQDDEECLQDVGERYVHIFIMRSFFQDVEMNKFGEIESFKMHDLIHDLSQSIASSDRCLFYERNFFESPVHINFAYCSKLSLDSLDVSRLRTILRLHCFSKSHLSNLLKFKRLRSLDFSEIDMTDLPDSIGKMIHLRYLDLSYCGKLTRLPKSLSKLVNLQTLKLTGCISLREPSSVDVITKLINLRHLHIEACPAFICAMPIGLDRLTNLQRLIYFVVGDQSYTKGKHAKLNELEELNLRHQLIIDNLDLVMDVEESRVAHLKAKKNLKSLTLRYSRSDINCDSVQVLENLCPHPNLKRLKITNYPGVKLSSWLPSLTNLVELNLYGFKNCQYLPPLEGLVSLKTLEIMDMDALEYIYYEGCSSSTNFFPSLEKLRIYECQSLRGWQREADTNNRKDNEKQLLLPSFPRLSYLEISGCLNLTCMPTFPSLVKFLCLEDCSMKPLIETLKVSATEELHPPLSILEHLKIYCKDIDFLPEEWMQNLTTLKRLDIGRPSSLVTVFCHMRHLPTTLEELFIGGIDNHNPWSSGDEDFSSQFQVLCCLHSLGHFEISDCDQNVKTLPEWICHLQTIRSIAIRFCPNLESWPEGMHRLTNLHTLYISSSPLLEERCERGRGAEWPKIAHVPNIWVGDCKI
ncbi:LOW QUALITY PROTEIN: putative disease resistance protein RGA3 [Prosopis cineraria]|uniref:LOW QUALITY PROTEIN: putative disease resistance protein RGA3 n=1 Tax=Prosopis cineraria TaxID=364024 RepID=UPI00240E9ED2|nr:LOW QUALITY PROTEIN: putative disease resistance protein RGA3 [Prosopis cineraria]